MELIYHICSFLIALLVFFMKFTVPNATAEVIFKALGKIVPFFVMAYSTVMIFKHCGVI
jgi:hypothetical protein